MMTGTPAADELATQLGGLALGGVRNGSDAAPAAHMLAAPSAGSSTSSSGLEVAGAGPALEALRELIVWPAKYGGEAEALGLRWPRGVLLHGPPGCGKSLMVRAVAAECGAVLHVVGAGDVFGAYMGEAERRLREAFEAASKDASEGKVAVIFLDEVDALCPRRDAGRQLESRVVAQLLTLLDGATALPSASATRGTGGPGSGVDSGSGRGHLVVVGATNRPNALDPALRRPGRLDREVAVGVPTGTQRAAILRLHLSGMALAPDLDLASVGESCHGYSGADLAALAREAALAALARVAAPLLTAGPSTLGHVGEGGGIGGSAVALMALGAGGVSLPEVRVGASDIAAAMRRVGPSIVRGIEVEVPHTSWDDVGGLPEVKRRLRQAVEWPLAHRDAFQRLGLTPPRGVLLYGPPGCSKTTLARAAACASRATLLPLSCAQLFSMYVGEGEAMLRDVFRRARAAAPSIVLLDEVDALAARREEGGDAGGGGAEAGVRLLTTLLTEMDGMELATGVLVLGATNRPGAVDGALMRPGRFDALLYVPPPDLEGRLEVLRIHTRAMPLDPDVDLPAIATATNGYTGAELAALCSEAALAALREDSSMADGPGQLTSQLDRAPPEVALPSGAAGGNVAPGVSGGAQGACFPRGADTVAARHFEAARTSSRAPAVGPRELAAYEEWGKARRAGK